MNFHFPLPIFLLISNYEIELIFFPGANGDEHKQVKVTESSSKHDHEKGKKIHSGKVTHKTEHEEGAGKKHVHHDEASHKSSEHHEGGSKDTLKHEDGSKRKKLNFKKVFDFYKICLVKAK